MRYYRQSLFLIFPVRRDQKIVVEFILCRDKNFINFNNSLRQTSLIIREFDSTMTISSTFLTGFIALLIICVFSAGCSMEKVPSSSPSTGYSFPSGHEHEISAFETNFTMDASYFNAGSGRTRAINFNDTSTNSPTNWTWYATNNTPGNNTEFVFSTLRAPTTTFGVGNWSIKVRTTNSTRSSNSSVQFLKGISLAGYTYYPSDHVYNVDISKLPINPKTSSWITTEGSSDFMYLTRFIFSLR